MKELTSYDFFVIIIDINTIIIITWNSLVNEKSAESFRYKHMSPTSMLSNVIIWQIWQ